MCFIRGNSWVTQLWQMSKFIAPNLTLYKKDNTCQNCQKQKKWWQAQIAKQVLTARYSHSASLHSLWNLSCPQTSFPFFFITTTNKVFNFNNQNNTDTRTTPYHWLIFTWIFNNLRYLFEASNSHLQTQIYTYIYRELIKH